MSRLFVLNDDDQPAPTRHYVICTLINSIRQYYIYVYNYWDKKKEKEKKTLIVMNIPRTVKDKIILLYHLSERIFYCNNGNRFYFFNKMMRLEKKKKYYGT